MYKRQVKYRRLDGMKYKTKVDFPMKCNKCGAGRATMIRSGYMDTATQPMKYKRFLCKPCGHVMLRLVRKKASSMPDVLIVNPNTLNKARMDESIQRPTDIKRK